MSGKVVVADLATAAEADARLTASPQEQAAAVSATAPCAAQNPGRPAIGAGHV